MKQLHGWDKEHFVYHCSDGDHNSFWKSVVESPQWYAWEKENAKRMNHTDGPTKDCYDVDECRECGWISPAHFRSFLDFCKTLK